MESSESSFGPITLSPCCPFVSHMVLIVFINASTGYLITTTTRVNSSNTSLFTTEYNPDIGYMHHSKLTPYIFHPSLAAHLAKLTPGVELPDSEHPAGEQDSNAGGEIDGSKGAESKVGGSRGGEVDTPHRATAGCCGHHAAG